MQKRLQVFLDSSGLVPARQSAYRRFRSAETAVAGVFGGLLLAAGGGEISALYLLGLAAAFGTVDHGLVLLRLERRFGLRGVVLEWFHSYLCDRTFYVIYNGSTSCTVYDLSLIHI